MRSLAKASKSWWYEGGKQRECNRNTATFLIGLMRQELHAFAETDLDRANYETTVGVCCGKPQLSPSANSSDLMTVNPSGPSLRQQS